MAHPVQHNAPSYSHLRDRSPDNKRDMIVTATGAYSIDYDAEYEARKDRRQGKGSLERMRAPPVGSSSGLPGAGIPAGRTIGQTDSLSPGIVSNASGYPGSLSRSELIQNIENNYDKERSRSRSRSKEGGQRSVAF